MISYSYYANFNKEQWREAATYVQQEEGAGDLIIINANYLELNFKHYYDGSNAVKGIQTIDQLKEALLATEQHKIWLILSHDDITDPNGQIKNVLDNAFQLNSEKDFISLDILNNISILGYSITSYHIEIEIYCYST